MPKFFCTGKIILLVFRNKLKNQSFDIGCFKSWDLDKKACKFLDSTGYSAQ